jgi:adenylate cyclase/guanylate cyclase
LNIGRKTRDAIAVAAIVLICTAVSVSPVFNFAHGLSIDILTALRWQMFGGKHDPANSPAVVVAIDEESYRTAPFKGSPTQLWTGEIGRVLSAVIDGGARVIGFDIVFPTSIEQSEIPFGGGVFGEKVSGFDRDFLRALAVGSAAGKVVLGEQLRGDQPIRPSQGQRIAVRQQQNIRALNVYVDSDDVIRRLPLTFTVDGKQVASMALELASRAIGATPEFRADGTVALAGYLVPGSVPDTMTLNFRGGADDIPTYSFADLRACAANGDRDFFRRQFDGKAVIIGTVLESEDRRITSKRFATGVQGAHAPRCALPEHSDSGRFKRSSIAGIYIHATAVNNLIARNAAVELGRLPIAAIAALLAAFTALAARTLKPLGAVLVFVTVIALYTIAATLAFNHSLVLPLSEPFIAGFAALAAMVGYRFRIADKDRRLLQKSFALYLAPDVIDRMLASNKLPVLGGETRHVTVLFSDLEGFSLIAETMSPEALMALMNEYLSEMTDIIEGYGGYVDKYIGDSIVAVFGAPADDHDHASNASRAALDCCARLDELNRSAAAFGGSKVAQRIGINSGDALVGNFGSRRRFNYSVMSDAVNLASRLEGANKFYGTTVIASETTVALTGEAFAWRELDTIRVKGRNNQLKIYQLLALAAELTPAQAAVTADYAAGLAHWRAGEFELAATCFERSAASDRPAALFLERARTYASQPPAGEWDPVRTLQEK